MNKRLEWEIQPFFKKHKWTITFFALFVIALAIFAITFDNYSEVVMPKYTHIKEAAYYLDRVPISLTNEEKVACIEKSIQLYGQGLNLEKIKALTPFNTNNDFGNVSQTLREEYNYYTVNPYVLGAFFEIGFIVCTMIGVTTVPDLWQSRRRQRLLLILTLTFLALFALKLVI